MNYEINNVLANICNWDVNEIQTFELTHRNQPFRKNGTWQETKGRIT